MVFEKPACCFSVCRTTKYRLWVFTLLITCYSNRVAVCDSCIAVELQDFVTPSRHDLTNPVVLDNMPTALVGM